ncbi:hypothetical protein Msip34_1471 [Methylovorus glucosotrophus SIP3-4]|uniref:Uncharacterized protein n=1 Tax=Methylovorus glucosotrophus (strain SIP3-4) TaxID=582744 RepID=C6XDU1_METGS|nr:hypothetical protein Msip34_1471 [Methylovorus glucosotrophus SIP3-4]
MLLSISLFSTPFTIETLHKGTFFQLGKYEAWIGRSEFVPHKRSVQELEVAASQHRGYFKRALSRYFTVPNQQSVPGVWSWEMYAFGLIVSLDRIERVSKASAIEL